MVLQYIFGFVVLIGVLVFIHELGHFLAARWTGMRANVFAIGMGPRLMGWNPKTGFTFGKLPEDLDLEDDTDYRLSAFPIGGYVKISGMVDESMDTEFEKHDPQPWEFRSKSTAQKAFVISAGVIMNILLAVVVLSSLNFFVGDDQHATTEVGPLASDAPAYRAGLRQGDRIVTVNGDSVATWEEMNLAIYSTGDDADLLVERNGRTFDVVIPHTELPQNPETDGILIPIAGVSVPILDVVSDSPAEEAGIQAGDTVVAVDGRPIALNVQLTTYIKGHADRAMAMQLKRGDSLIIAEVKPDPETQQIGVQLGQHYSGEYREQTYGFFGAIGAGLSQTWTILERHITLIGNLITQKAKLKDSVGGPGLIAKYAGESVSAGLVPFLRLMAILSVTLAFMNILPIPALDGGHLVFILVEGIMRREISTKVRVAVQQAGFALLILLMAFVLYNDALRLFGG